MPHPEVGIIVLHSWFFGHLDTNPLSINLDFQGPPPLKETFLKSAPLIKKNFPASLPFFVWIPFNGHHNGHHNEPSGDGGGGHDNEPSGDDGGGHDNEVTGPPRGLIFES